MIKSNKKSLEHNEEIWQPRIVARPPTRLVDIRQSHQSGCLSSHQSSQPTSQRSSHHSSYKSSNQSSNLSSNLSRLAQCDQKQQVAKDTRGDAPVPGRVFSQAGLGESLYLLHVNNKKIGIICNLVYKLGGAKYDLSFQVSVGLQKNLIYIKTGSHCHCTRLNLPLVQIDHL